MLPVGPLMTEHRLIERMINALKESLLSIEKNGKVDTDFIGEAVDFLTTYADKCHHGKEEDILFNELSKKDIKEGHRKTMDSLIEDHRSGRKAVRELVKANDKYKKGDMGSLGPIKDSLKELTDLYPRHIAREDKDFFLPVMDYFSDREKENMLNKFRDFDRNLIHMKYREIAERTGGRKEQERLK